MEKIQAAVKKSRRRMIRLGYLILILITSLSLMGLAAPREMYPVENALENFQINDLLNLLLGVPLLLVPILVSRNHKSFGFLIWTGGLLYNFYNYLAYCFSLPLGLNTLMYILLLGLMALNAYQVLRIQDLMQIFQKVRNRVPARFGGWFLSIFGIIFFGRSAAFFWESMAGSTSLPLVEIGVLVADAFLSLVLISGGVLLIRHKPLGYVAGPGLMLAVSALFLGVIVLVLLQPFFTGTLLDLEALLTLLVMSLIFWIPAWLFLRSTLRGLRLNQQTMLQS